MTVSLFDTETLTNLQTAVWMLETFRSLESTQTQRVRPPCGCAASARVMEPSRRPGRAGQSFSARGKKTDPSRLAGALRWTDQRPEETGFYSEKQEPPSAAGAEAGREAAE